MPFAWWSSVDIINLAAATVAAVVVAACYLRADAAYQGSAGEPLTNRNSMLLLLL